MTRSIQHASSVGLDYKVVAIVGFTLGFALAASYADAAQSYSHCTNSETVVFSCKVRSSPKYISLCSSKSLHASDGYLTYRFGPLGRKELEYPANTDGSIKKFKTSHYFRAQVDRRDISFTNSNVTYDIFSNFEGEESPSHWEGGITIIRAGKSTSGKTLYCASPYIDKLELLDGIVMKGPDYVDDEK